MNYVMVKLGKCVYVLNASSWGVEKPLSAAFVVSLNWD